MAREYTDDMREISGFGGGYEDMCRQMVLAGLDWLDANPTADPKFRSYSNIYGVIDEENDDAKALTAAIVAPSKGDCSGAMHQAVVYHVLFIKKNGWEKYCEEMRKKS